MTRFIDIIEQGEERVAMLECDGAAPTLIRAWPRKVANERGIEVLRNALDVASDHGIELGRGDLRALAAQRHGEDVFTQGNAWLATVYDRETGDAEPLWSGVVWAPSAHGATTIVEKGGIIADELPEYRIALLQLSTGHTTGLSCRREMPELDAAVEQLRRLLTGGHALSEALRMLLVAYPRWHGGEVFRLLYEGCSLGFRDACRVDSWEGIGSVGVSDEQLDAELGPTVAAALDVDAKGGLE